MLANGNPLSTNNKMDNYIIPAQTRIGHVHLRVADLERSIDFYCGLLGFEIITRYGTDAAFISAGGYHHHIGLNTWYSKGAAPANPHAVGLFHTAILYPTRKDLATIFKRLHDANYKFSGAADHGVSEALYLDDPDGNGVELYWDKPKEEWPLKEDGSLELYTRHLDLDKLLSLLK
jgi:catechol 2,3-dioxygenase